MPSLVLSADSMHIGILAAAAHAAASRSPFTIFYNPRACPSDFVVPYTKYRKIYSTKVHVGMRFGMMFETEESSKRRYMGTITGISDLDPLSWPNSKWRCLRVEWDEPGYIDKQTRVSPWEIETPQDLFIFPSLTPNLKRPFRFAFVGPQTEWDTLTRRFHRFPENSIGMWSDQLMKMRLEPYSTISQVETPQGEIHFSNSSILVPGKQLEPNKLENQTSPETSSELTKLDVLVTDHSSQFESFNEEKLPAKMMNRTNPLNCFSVMNQINGHIPLDPYSIQTQQIDPPHVEFSTYPPICSSPLESSKSPGSLSMVKKPDQHQTSPDTAYPVLPSFGQEFRDPHFSNTERVYQPNIPMLSPYQEMWNPQSAIYSCFNPADNLVEVHLQAMWSLMITVFCSRVQGSKYLQGFEPTRRFKRLDLLEGRLMSRSLKTTNNYVVNLKACSV